MHKCIGPFAILKGTVELLENAIAIIRIYINSMSMENYFSRLSFSLQRLLHWRSVHRIQFPTACLVFTEWDRRDTGFVNHVSNIYSSF